MPLELEHKAYWAIKGLNYDFKLADEKRLFDISSLDEWRTQACENAKLFKEKVKTWHDRRIQNGNSKLENMFFCTILVLDYLQENFSLNGKDHILSRRLIALELSRSIMPKVVNGQRMKHYISGTPINVESNISQTMTPEEDINETFRNTPES